MRTTTLTIGYLTLVALGALAVVATGVDLPLADHHPVPEQSLAGLVPRSVFLVLAAVLSLVLAETAALSTTARRPSAERRSVLPGSMVLGGLAAALLVVLTLSVEFLAFLGYLPLAFLMAPFHEGMRTGFVDALNASVLSQLVVMLGVLLWGQVARQHLRARPGPLPAWARPRAAARWGRVAVVVAVIPPVLYALTRFVWLFYPLGFDRAAWEEAKAGSTLLPGLWLGTFAVLGAALTLGLTQRWGEVFPRWVPGLRGRRVPVALAVVPASFVAIVLVPSGISMIRQVLTRAAGFDFIADWAAFGPTFLWPLWGVALGVATLGYALRRRDEGPAAVDRDPAVTHRGGR